MWYARRGVAAAEHLNVLARGVLRRAIVFWRVPIAVTPLSFGVCEEDWHVAQSNGPPWLGLMV
jgi:hypothetical protein